MTKKVFNIGLLLLAVAVLAGSARASFADCRCRIKELLKVHSPAEFTCRVDRFAGVENLKLRISIRGVEFVGDAEAIREKEEQLKKLLSNTRVLELTNIRDRFYFRILADVKADGVDVKEYLEKGQFKREPNPPISQGEADSDADEADPAASDSLASFAAPVESNPNARAVRDVYSLLETRADLSALTAQTPLEEAFALLSRSTNPPLPILILWGDLKQNAFLDRRTPIGADGFAALPVGQALNLILLSAGGTQARRPVAVVDGSIVTVGTAGTLKPKYVNRVHSIETLSLPQVWVVEELRGGWIAPGFASR